MGWQARLNRKRHSLPPDEWQCIWCDRSPPDVKFERREHVIPESLGGERDFRLLRGLVCDSCNAGVLKQIDDELNLHPLIRGLRFTFGLGTPFRELVPGMRREGDVMTLSPGLIRNGDRLELKLVRGGGGTVTMQTGGPSDMTKPEHLARGLHRMAYNAIAHAHGAARAREYGHLREYVLTGHESMRAYLLDERSLNESVARTHERWTASYELLPQGGDDRRPDVAFLRLGMLFFYVSLEPTTAPLVAVQRRFSWLRVAGEIDR